MKLFKQNILLLIVFVTGACVLIIEITALRILSPYFGNTIYTSSSVISVILAALSCGYYLGGRLADRRPERKIFFLIILASGLATLITFTINLIFLPSLSQELSLVEGPLISAFVLFTVPAFLLGTLSPYVIKLQEIVNPKLGTGSLSGQVFFWSTLGSIVGSLLTGFFFIPYFGVSQIVIATGVVLSLIGFVGVTANLKKKWTNLLIIGISFLSSLPYVVLKSRVSVNTIYSKDGVYEKIEIQDRELNGHKSRILYQDISFSSGKYLDSQELAFSYTKYFSLYKLFEMDINHALVLGGGAYTIPNALVKDNTNVIVDVVDIEPELLDIAKQYFDVSDNVRIISHTGDGRRFLKDNKNTYDYIFSDVYSSLMSLPVHLTTKEFFLSVKDSLNSDGIFIANVICGINRDSPNLFLSEAKTLLSVFPNSYFFATVSPGHSRVQNVIFLAVNSDTLLSEDALTNYIVDGNKTLADKRIKLERFDMSNQIVLTDNYSPIERMIADNIKNYERIRVFNANEVVHLIKQQVDMGSRYVVSNAHEKARNLIINEMELLSDEVVIQSWKDSTYDFTNLIFRTHPEKKDRFIIATHYDSKKKSLDKPNLPVPGANDSASGTAMLIELARGIKEYNIDTHYGIDYVFFDGEEGLEDFGESKWEAVGSKYFANNLKSIYESKPPKGAIIVDMICDKDLTLYKEINSNMHAKEIVDNIWSIGANKNESIFKNDIKYSIADDHTSLNDIGIPSVLIIDYDYPYFHTTHDLPDKCSEDNLKVIGETLMEFMKSPNLL
ncbi:fused MFS/spermidine synthase [Candidatus Woesebacteria bacterium]|nr:MAG: fused MFS/spermidine synthase [Candidatus Woesebacteria bacterium]